MAEHDLGVEQLIPLTIKLIENDIDEAIKMIEELPSGDAADIIAALPAELATRILSRLQVSFTASLLDQSDPALIKKMVMRLVPQQAASVIMYLSPESRARIIPNISGKLVDEIKELLTYPEESVGRYMTTDFLVFKEKDTAETVVKKLKQLTKSKTAPASYTYVVDEDLSLLGVINTRDLLLAEPEQTLETFMVQSVFSIHCFTDRSDAAREMAKRNYFAAPIVDGENRLVGIIRAESMLRGVKEDISGDIQKMFGVSSDERTFSPVLTALKKRLFWLMINLGTAFLAASVIALFEDIIAKLTILAVFLPVIAGQGGNAGAQSLAVVMRGLVMREISPSRVTELILKEIKLGALNGVIIGIVTAGIAYLWYGNYWLGLVIGLGMLVNLVIAGFAGSSIPIIMKRLGIDPAQSSSIVLTTVTDVMGFLAFLGLAVLFQQYLV